MTNFLITISLVCIGGIIGMAVGYGIDCIADVVVNQFQASMPPLSPEWSNVANKTIGNLNIARAVPDITLFRILGTIAGGIGGIYASTKV